MPVEEALVARLMPLFIGDMPPCHTVPFTRPGVLVTRETTPPPATHVTETCDYCGSEKLEWRKCKLVCSNCQQINKSCADL